MRITREYPVKNFLQTMLLMLATAHAGAALAPAAAIEPLIEARIAALADGEPLQVLGTDLRNRDTLQEFYTARGFRPAWTDPEAVAALVDAVRNSAREGLQPEHYRLNQLLALQEKLAARQPSVFARADAELLFSDTLAQLAREYASGRVAGADGPAAGLRPDPAQPAAAPLTAPPFIAAPAATAPATAAPAAAAQATTAPPAAEAAALLARLIGPDLQPALNAELPQHPLYRAMRDQLARHREIAAAGGWPEIPAGQKKSLKPGERDERLPLLRQRLAISGDYGAVAAENNNSIDGGTDGIATAIDPDVYDDTLVAAMKRFQSRHGLTADGAVGPATLAQLNVPVGARIDTLRVNLDRARVLTQDMPPRFVVVNIAGFHVYLIENGKLRWQSRAVVGQLYRQTPQFRSAISYLQWNPTWTVPPGIILKDILPDARRDPHSITRRGLQVLDADGNVLDPAGIDWHRFRSGHIPYTLRQQPGPKNALGRVKFMFPNSHQVYLHDTPSKGLFGRDARTFSSGCVRVEDAFTLARLLIDDPEWDDGRIAKVLEEEEPQTLVLKQRVPILLAYWTAWVDETGALQFRPDIYGRDAAWLAALDAAP